MLRHCWNQAVQVADFASSYIYSTALMNLNDLEAKEAQEKAAAQAKAEELRLEWKRDHIRVLLKQYIDDGCEESWKVLHDLTANSEENRVILGECLDEREKRQYLGTHLNMLVTPFPSTPSIMTLTQEQFDALTRHVLGEYKFNTVKIPEFALPPQQSAFILNDDWKVNLIYNPDTKEPPMKNTITHVKADDRQAIRSLPGFVPFGDYSPTTGNGAGLKNELGRIAVRDGWVYFVMDVEEYTTYKTTSVTGYRILPAA